MMTINTDLSDIATAEAIAQLKQTLAATIYAHTPQAALDACDLQLTTRTCYLMAEAAIAVALANEAGQRMNKED